MIDESVFENLAIHNDNLSVYYLGSVFITVLSVVFTWWYHSHYVNKNEILDSNLDDLRKKEIFEGDDANVLTDRDNTESLVGDRAISHLKPTINSLVEEVAANLSEQQLQEEKEVEKQQLEAIFQLLQNQQDKYQVSSMEELEDQLKLYR